jgi:hypothetical protein
LPDCQNSAPPEWLFQLGSDCYVPRLYQFIIHRTLHALR